MRIGRMMARGSLLALALTLVAGTTHAARRPNAPLSIANPNGTKTLETDRRIDINNVNMFVTNYGAFGYDLGGNYNGGFFFPNHTDKTAIYAAGLWVGAKVGGAVRVTVAEYDQEYRPGRIIAGVPENPGNPDLIVYKVLRWRGVPADTAHADNPTADFSRGEDPLAHHSWSEYINGAKPYGAPTRMWRLPDTATPAPTDSVDVEGPDVLGDMMLWCIYNDGQATAHTNAAGNSLPLNLQVEQKTFAFDRPGALGNTIFVTYSFKNAGPDTLREMYVSQWSDPDLGGFTDDLVGCDTLPDFFGKRRSLGFVYNGTNRDDIYGDVPPALGIDFLKGPLDALGDTLGLASFAKYINGTDPADPAESYNYMTGHNGDGSVIVDPYGKATRYMDAGDPQVKASLGNQDQVNWVDSNPADRRFFLSTGPITMLPGDVQTVTVAIVVGQCGDRLRSLNALKFTDDAAQEAFDLGFIVPIPPTSPNVTASSDHGQVTLAWDTAAQTGSIEPGYQFEGYKVYQGATIAGPWRLVAVYDSTNGLREVFDKSFSDASCEITPLADLAHGTDFGIRHQHVTTQDFVRGTTLKDGTTYYFAVTAFVTNPSAPANRVLESSLKAVEIMPQRAANTVTPSQIRAVPNPYYAHSAYELTQFNRRIRFLNVPSQCTLRIYNLAGQLVRTIRKDDPSTSVLEWDIETDRGLPVGSGVYVYHVEAPGGSVRGRVVVFMEKERLNNF
jgi:hypothetical protein